MRRLLCIAGLGLVATACYVPASDPRHQVEADWRRGVPVVPARINGVDVWCVVDTGNSGFYVSPRFGGSPWTGIGTPIPTTISELVFAGWQFSGQAYTGSQAVFDNIGATIGHDAVDCWLGAGVLANLRLTVDPFSGVLDFADPTTGLAVPANVRRVEPYVFEPLYSDGLFVGSVGLQDDFDGVMMLSTGLPAVTLASDAVADLAVQPDLDSSGEWPVGRLTSVALGDSALADVPLQVRDDLGFDTLRRYVGLRVDGAVGAAVLTGYVTTWDYQAGVVELRAYDADVQAALYEGLDAELRQAGW